MAKTYSFPTSGVIKTKLRFDWQRFRGQLRGWFKESREGIVFGTLLGLFIASCYSLMVIIQVMARRSAWFPSVELSAWKIIASYFVAFPIAGAIVGPLAPALRWRAAAVVAGIIAGCLVYGITQLVAEGFHAFSLQSALQPGIGLGGPVGYYLHYELVPGRRWPQWREVLTVLLLGVTLAGVELLIA